MGILAAAVVIASALALGTSEAETPAPQAFTSMKQKQEKPSADVAASAEFVQAAVFQVQHEPLNESVPGIETGNAVKRMAYITVSGLLDETMVMTCGIESRTNGIKRTRDCAGAAEISGHALMGGQSVDSGILLTRDLLPNGQDASDSSISIEVTYL